MLEAEMAWEFKVILPGWSKVHKMRELERRQAKWNTLDHAS